MVPMSGLFMLKEKELIIAGFLETALARLFGEKHVIEDSKEGVKIVYYVYRNCSIVWTIDYI